MSQNDKMAVSAADVEQAARHIGSHVVQTPMLHHPWLDELAGRRVLLKAEMLQTTGSFKYRGAFNRMSRFTDAEKRRGVVAWSSGNHAQGVAATAEKLGIAATIVMPADAPAVKIRNTRRYGAEVVLYDRYRESREDIAAAIVARTGAIPVAPNDDPLVVAGYGTVGVDMSEQAQAAGETLGSILVPCGGGGLVAGIATVMQKLSPATKVFAVEPADLDDTLRSIEAGARVRNDPEARSICDALTAPTPAAIPWPMIRDRVAGVLTATDTEVRAAMAVAHELLKVTVEPGGAVALAAALARKSQIPEGTVCVLLSGGNVDAALFRDALSTASAEAA